MPIYEFFCPNCNSKQEEIFIDRENLNNVSCHQCSSIMERIISATGGRVGRVRDIGRKELNGDRDMFEAYKSLEERGKLNEVADKNEQNRVLEMAKEKGWK